MSRAPQTRNKIALVTNTFGGGVWTVLRFLLAAVQRSQEFDVDIVTLAFSSRDRDSVRLLSPTTWLRGPQASECTLDGLPITHVGALLTEFEFQRYNPRKVLDQVLSKYDLIQVVGGSPAPGNAVLQIGQPVCLFAATTAEAESNAQIEGDVLLRIWRKRMVSFATRAEQRALAQADAVFAESEYTRRLVEGKTRPGALVLGPPGVDADFFRPPVAPSLGGPITCVGRLRDSRKNVRLLLQAYALLSKRMKMPPLHLVGRGGITSTDRQFIQEAGISDGVRVFNDVSMEELRELYRMSSLFVLPSNEEGLGIVILEAMACGLPVISTDCGGPATAIVAGETGLLTAVGDAESLAEAVGSLSEDPGRRLQMGAAGRKRIEERFTIERAGAVYLNEYRRLLSENRGANQVKQ